MGGKHRRLIGGAELFADDTVDAFREATLELLETTAGFGIDTLNAEQLRLEVRLQRFGACRDALDIWAAEGVPDARSVPALPADQFIELADKIRRIARDAR
jgi:malonate decarboxylase beta subunit